MPDSPGWHYLGDGVSITCPKCAATFRDDDYAEAQAGVEIECPSCGAVIVYDSVETSLDFYGHLKEEERED